MHHSSIYLQINETTTAFLGGLNNYHAITTFDWTSKTYTSHETELTGSRVYSSCALLNGENGEKLVAVASGSSPGMEVWNPNDGSVKTLTPDFPYKVLVGSGQLVSVQDGAELIFYQDLNNNYEQGVWKYTQADGSWLKIGDMLHPRAAFVALPVPNLTCN